MPRRSPLQELPLDRFVVLDPLSRKRPLSPGTPILFSPAKRRILNGEGVFSPEKSLKTPLSGRHASSRFTQVLSGPESPARKLDFGCPSNTSAPSHFSPSYLSPTGQNPEDYFSQPCSSSSCPPPALNPPVQKLNSLSNHYPGFLVYHDPEGLSPTDDNQLQPDVESDTDVVKENIPPRRKSRKATPTLDKDFKLSTIISPASKPELEKRSRRVSFHDAGQTIIATDNTNSTPQPSPIVRTCRGPSTAALKGTFKRLRDELDDEDHDPSL